MMDMANGNVNGAHTKEKIMRLLKERPLGLTIRDISTALSIHRQTIAKYLLVMEAEGRVHRRVVGSASLHYPKEAFEDATAGKASKEKTAKKRKAKER